jgi:hypothetical protein
MAEDRYLEDLEAKEMEALEIGSALRSRDGKMIAIKRTLCWEILCEAIFKDENPEERYLCVTYNEKPLGKLFGAAVNSYTNYLTPGATAARHFHRRFKEIFRVESPASSLKITLADPETGKRDEFALDGKLTEFEGKKWLREIIIPAGIAHKLHNASLEIAAISVTTSGQHDADDIFPFEM